MRHRPALPDNGSLVARRTVLTGVGALAALAALNLDPDRAAAQGGSCYPGPGLFFTTEELPGLRATVASPTLAPAWAKLVAQAEDFINPDSPNYADADKLATWPSTRNTFSRWIEALGFVGLITGDTRYSDHGRQVLMGAVSKLEVGGPILDQANPEGESGAPCAIFAMGHDWLGAGLSRADRTALENAMISHIHNVRSKALIPDVWYRPYANFMGYVIGGAGLAALRLDQAGVPRAMAWAAASKDLVEEWFDNGFDDQGASVEGTYYPLFGLTNAVRFLDALGPSGHDLLRHPHLLRFPHFLAMELLPGSPPTMFDARNDAIYGNLRTDTAIGPVMLKLSDVNNSGLGRWLQNMLWPKGNSVFEVIWHNEQAAASPEEAGEPLSEHFEGRGLVVFRTGWRQESGHQDVMFSIEAGRYYATSHNQADKGHFALYGCGHRWAIDSAYGNNRSRVGRGQTLAHNCVLVDGRGQALSGGGLGTNGTIAAYDDRPEYGYVLADCVEAYRANIQDPALGMFTPEGYKPEDNEVNPMERALRHAFFIRPSHGAREYAIVVDDIQQDDGEHDYTWQMLSVESMRYEFNGRRALLIPGSASARLNFHIAGATSVTLERSSYTSDRVFPNSPATVPVLTATTRAVNPRFAALLVPRPGNVAAPQSTITVDQAGAHLTVIWPGRRDEIHVPWATGAQLPAPVHVSLQPV